jgi:hypothetical protein
MGTTSRQLAANRRNARRSTGPRSAAGKAISARNAVRHGLLAQTVLLPGEDPDELDALRDAIIERLEPDGAIELVLTDTIVGLAWRLRRAGAIERGLYALGLFSRLADAIGAETNEEAKLGWAFASQADGFASLARYETTLSRAFTRTLGDLERLQAARQAPITIVAPTVEATELTVVS